MGFIYGIKHPLKEQIVYIGRTIRKNPTTRLDEHIEEAMKGSNRLLCIWIREIISLGYKPEQVILKCGISNKKISAIETEYIICYNKKYPLLNQTQGVKRKKTDELAKLSNNTLSIDQSILEINSLIKSGLELTKIKRLYRDLWLEIPKYERKKFTTLYKELGQSKTKDWKIPKFYKDPEGLS